MLSLRFISNPGSCSLKRRGSRNQFERERKVRSGGANLEWGRALNHLPNGVDRLSCGSVVTASTNPNENKNISSSIGGKDAYPVHRHLTGRSSEDRREVVTSHIFEHESNSVVFNASYLVKLRCCCSCILGVIDSFKMFVINAVQEEMSMCRTRASCVYSVVAIDFHENETGTQSFITGPAPVPTRFVGPVEVGLWVCDRVRLRLAV